MSDEARPLRPDYSPALNGTSTAAVCRPALSSRLSSSLLVDSLTDTNQRGCGNDNPYN
jgi:hypothetical protein